MQVAIQAFILFFLSFYVQDANPELFEGKIVYKSLTKDFEGKLIPSRTLNGQTFYYKDTFYKFVYPRNETLTGPPSMEVIVNTQDTTWYTIHHADKEYRSLNMETGSEAYLPRKIHFIHANDTILGYPCKKYELIQLEFYNQQEVKSYIWIAEELKVMNLPLLGKIFGYRNTLIKDGSLGGIALKYESLGSDGSVSMLTEAIEIKPMTLDSSDFAVPVMYRGQ
ncbi:DUF4412 domain-containing protein [Porifericola rhodea]|uniref:DUF4412 domain-containing protein n=1 Tax=Porifericola rhodea TaxID=930972 RepID=UPI0026661A9F|nr:DUF4412 domain-containing protein [Porifericola rhodea]WKN29772.1 DUF4412 domain-containing protein [Porifericola rhodea]